MLSRGGSVSGRTGRGGLERGRACVERDGEGDEAKLPEQMSERPVGLLALLAGR